MYSTSDFRIGMKIIVDFQHVKPGKGNAFTRTRIKNLLTGRTLDPTFKSGEKVGKPDIEERQLQYLYKDGEHYTFMDNLNYEQLMVDAVAVGEETAKWLKENTDCAVLFYNGKAIGVTVPNHIVLKIVQCEPGVRGDNATKPATLETGAIVNVPLFINEGESVKVDTREGTYIERG
jgi:elongation factor P